jgi:predicted transposase YdaD
MKTDELFYELFRFSPESLLELVQLDVSGPYRFESITVKSTEKRFDGYFKNVGDKGPDIFLEIQGYRDHNIYWRLFREICAFHEQRKDHRPFAAVVLFIDASLDPGNPPLNPAPPHQLIRRDMVECLKSIRDNATPLVVLKPLTLENKADLPKAVDQWKAGIDAMALPEDRKKTLTELLEYAILQRFKTITLEELQKMIELTPIEESVAFQEMVQKLSQKLRRELSQKLRQELSQKLSQELSQKLRQEFLAKGQLIGQIRLIERLLKRPQTPKESLALLDVEELETMLANLETDLGRLEL